MPTLSTSQSPDKGLLSLSSLDGLLINQPHYQALFKDFSAELTKQREATNSELNQAINDGASIEELQPLQDRAWHAVRRCGISGTNASVILGLNKYKTPYELYNELTGRVIPPSQNNVFTEWGHRLEDVVAQKYADQHKARLVAVDSFVSSAFPFMTASIDRLVVDENNEAKAVLELKTAGFNSKTVDESGEIDRVWGKGNQYISVRNADGSTSLQLIQQDSQCPASYLSQVLHYMIATGVYNGQLAVLIGGHDYREFTIPFDYEAAEALIRAEDNFFCKHVLDDIAPNLSAKELAHIEPEKKSEIEATPEIAEMARKLKAITSEMDALKASSDELKNKLIEFMGTNEHITLNKNKLVSYTLCKGRSSVDVDALKEAYNKLALANNLQPEEFTKQGASYRRFSVKIKD